MRVLDANSPQGNFGGVVCLLDDEPEFRLELGEFLSHSGFQVNLFSDGYDFLHWVRGDSFQAADCVICDWNLAPESAHLPPINAPAVLRMVEHYLNASPAIVLTDEKDGEETIHQAMLHGARGFVTKPIEKSELLERVNLLVRMHNNIERSNIWSSTARIAKEKKVSKAGVQAARNGNGGSLSNSSPGDVTSSRKAAAKIKEPAEPRVAASLSKETIGTGKIIDAALAWEIGPVVPPEESDFLDEEIVHEYAISFEDLVVVFEDSVLKLELLYDGGQVEDFSAAFDLAQTGYRALHTLKGNAGFLNAERSQGLIHRMEDVLGLVRSQPDSLSEQQISRFVDLFLLGKDVLGGICQYLRTYQCEKGYETSPAFELYENVCLRIKIFEDELQAVASESQGSSESFEDMF